MENEENSEKTKEIDNNDIDNVIKLKESSKYDRKGYIHPRKKQKILERDGFRCLNCGVSGDFNSLEVDHIIPVIEGGDNSQKNLQTLCYRCNLNKRFNKNRVKEYFLDVSPLERLELVKNRLKEYKYLTYPEFKVVFTQDDLFKKLRIDLLYLNDLFFEISGTKKEFNLTKFKNERDICLFLLRKSSKLSYREIQTLLKDYNFDISYKQISRVCVAFGDKDDSNEELSKELIVKEEN